MMCVLISKDRFHVNRMRIDESNIRGSVYQDKSWDVGRQFNKFNLNKMEERHLQVRKGEVV